jgi:CDP-paratose synthetase
LKALVTGGSGFLGSALALHLRANGSDVAVLLRPASRLDRLRGLEVEMDVGRCETDADVETFVRRMQPDVVIHTACSFGRYGESPLQITDTNVRLGLQIFHSLMQIGKPVTFINTGTVLAPEVSLYALTKYQFVQLGRLLASQPNSQIRFLNVLLQHIYGPGDDASKFITHVLHSCQRNEPELKLTPGDQRRDFIFIDDVVSAYAVLIKRREELVATFDVEIGSGVAPTVRAFVETAHRLTGSSTRLNFGAVPYRENEAMYCRADISRMLSLGWKPIYDIEAGLKKTIQEELPK